MTLYYSHKSECFASVASTGVIRQFYGGEPDTMEICSSSRTEGRVPYYVALNSLAYIATR